MTPTYTLEKLDFTGPLDLLLHLIEKDKVDIYDIPIAEIARQYMESVSRMEETDLEVVSDFLVMAATLLDIKAAMLLPKEKNEEGEETDPRAELVARLLEYKRIRFIARELRKYEEFADGYRYGSENIPEEVLRYRPPADLDALLKGLDFAGLRKVYEELMKRREYKRDERRSEFGVIRRERIPLRHCIGSLISFARKNSRFSFRQLLGRAKDRTEVVVMFLAVLELMKVGMIEATQEPGEDIGITATGNIFSEPPDFDSILDE